MRSALVPLVLLAFLPSALAQTGSPSFDVLARYDAGPYEPGNGTEVVFTLTRLCSNMVTVNPEQSVDVQILGPADVSVSGPMQVVFPQQACAQMPQQPVDATYKIHLPANATRGSVVELLATFQPRPASTPGVFSPGDEVRHALAFEIASAPAVVASSEAEPAQEAPLLPSAFLALALLGAAFALRRR